ncbi:lysophospholipase, putative [Plasmodium chabaudi chabaudi]|uniref:Lysophospholipase, putative n=2 Tax=Plasmodium chabaudi chabaudi TaxID=31271 RepID=A0A4V0K1Q4_PLACU|nr:lysophospholipase, putative [Plasmodium chabaudi chabaudi]VTZ66753.1 lysophospholipase, putative [Plasmodium chabaudi chabaudi]|eukprot:XP_016655688.1 lysophospholipase, putative [Plasmodium chabaudi chabaudi]
MDNFRFKNLFRNAKYKLAGKPKEGWLFNKNGLLLKTYRWLVNNPIGIVLLIHGFQGNTQLTFMKEAVQTVYSNKGMKFYDKGFTYKGSWIEKFNQNNYSVYGIDLQGHGGSQSPGKIRGSVNCFNDLVDDVIQYMNEIQDDISNENQTDDESHDIVPTKKKRLPMYVIGHSMGGNIALRILQLLGKEKEDRIKAKDSKTMLCNFNDINETDNDADDMNNANDYDSDNSGASASTMANGSSCANNKDERCYNCLDNLNIKGCVSLAGMIRINIPFDSGNKSFNDFYLPIINYASQIAPDARLLVNFRRHNPPTYSVNIHNNNNGLELKCVYELIKATVTLDSDINYMPKDIPFLIVHSKDDSMCSYEWAASFCNKAKTDKKELYSLDDMDHVITTNPGYEDVLKKVADWISDVRMNDNDEIKHDIKHDIKPKIKHDIKPKIKHKIKQKIRHEIEEKKENEIYNAV